MSLPDRFWDWVDQTDRTCWLWRGSLAVDGYGRFRFEGKQWYAHRLAYVALVGPVPDGLELDHLCRNRGCVNPAHLEPVLGKVNILRGQGPPARNARRTTCIRGHALHREGDRRQCSTCRRVRTREAMRRLRARRKEVAEANSSR